jgi:N-acetylglucosamine-6-phosphate deacetylase
MTHHVIARDYSSGQLIRIQIKQDIIYSIDDNIDPGEHGTSTPIPWICPGLLDLHINGFAGHDLNSPEVTKETVKEMVEALALRGVTSCMPTVITASHEQMSNSIAAIRQACEEDAVIDKSVIGIHLEGPYLSPELGFRGAHPVEEMRTPDWEEFITFQQLSGNRIKKVTLAPELHGAADFIERLTDHGVIAAMGHSNASREHVQAAIKAGLTMCTHLGNGIHYIINRHAACLWDLLASEQLYAGFIADGHHLPESVIKVITTMKGNRAILVSDAVHLAGLNPGRYRTHIGGEVDLLPNGRLQLASNPNVLAGSASSIWDGLQNMLKIYPGNLKKAIDLATKNPAHLLKTKIRGQLLPGAYADFILFDTDDSFQKMHIRQIWRQGQQIWGESDENHSR